MKNNNQTNALSLFDGMSCFQIALKELNIKIDNYYASEVDKHAIAQTKHAFPNTIHLGDVRDIDVTKLPYISILGGGSPCQSFSFAGKMKGMSTKENIKILELDHYLELKSKQFEFEGQSYLFWEYMRILRDIQKYNPDVEFLLENVVMTKDWELVLSRAIGIAPIMINAALVSAQNRKRLYWTNIYNFPQGFLGDPVCEIPQPKDRGILLKDILEPEVDEKYYLSDKALSYLLRAKEERTENVVYNDGSEKTSTLTANYHRGVHNGGETYVKDNLVMQVNPSKESNGKQPFQQNRIYDSEGISPALCAHKADLIIKENIPLGCDYRTDEGIRIRKNGKSGTLAARARNDESCGQLVITIPEATKKGYVEIQPGECFDFEHPDSSTRRGRKMTDKSNTLMASETKFMQLTKDFRIRRLTPKECQRLQTVPEWYSWGNTSDTQIYRMLGNGWSIEVIKHILSYSILNK